MKSKLVFNESKWRADWERIGAAVECTSCGYYTNERSHFCPHCGKPMDKEALEVLKQRLQKEFEIYE